MASGGASNVELVLEPRRVGDALRIRDNHRLRTLGQPMKVILEEKDLLPLIQRLLFQQYPEFEKAHVEFHMRRKWLSSKAVLTVECELTTEVVESKWRDYIGQIK